MSVTAIVLAGQRPGTDPLAAHFGGDMKALVPIAGEAMVLRPVRALMESRSATKIIVMAQQAARLRSVLAGLDGVEVRESQGTIAETLLALVREPTLDWPVLVTTADHALLTPATVDEFCAAAPGADIAAGVVDRETLLRRLPDSRRTWIEARGEAVTGANLFRLSSPACERAIELWRSVEQDRKKAWRLVALLGPFWLAMAAMRLVGLDDLARRLGVKLGLALALVRLSYPLAGVDVDSVADHALVERIIAGEA